MSVPSRPFASVVIITHNRLPHLKKCLESLSTQSYADFEIVVVDDASADGTAAYLKTAQTPFVRLEQNAGVSAARNAGIKAARGEVVVFIDDDCTLPGDWLAELLKSYEDPSVDGAGGRVIVLPDNYVSFDHGGVDRFGTVKTSHAGPGFQPYLVGCHMSFRKKALEAAGLFDESFFYGYDESDLCIRLQRTGHKLAFNDKALVYHQVIFDGKYRHDKFYWGARSRRHFVWKNFTPGFFPLLGFELGNLGYNLYRFAAGLLGIRRRIPLLELESALQGALAGHVVGLRTLATRRQGFGVR